MTLLIAGLIALVQVDIKRVIAYSTMSQIGYMFLGAGLGAYASAMFHLMTHAFFKALLFLAAGIVIHALVGEQDMRKMGGLKRFLPRTYLAFLIGALALDRDPAALGVLLQGLDPRLGARRRLVRAAALRRRASSARSSPASTRSGWSSSSSVESRPRTRASTSTSRSGPSPGSGWR